MSVEAMLERDDPAYRGQARYTPLALKLYDPVLFTAVTVVWRCSVRRMVRFYDENAAAKHLDIGVGTGALIDRAEFPTAEPDITLMDLNANCLKAASRRVRRYKPRTHQANILKPWGLASASFGSVGIMNMLHCVPADSIKEKAVAFDYAREVLVPGGTLFGSTILAKGVRQTWLSRSVMKFSNRTGDLVNSGDSLEDLSDALASRFPEHRVDAEGSIAFFVAKMPD